MKSLMRIILFLCFVTLLVSIFPLARADTIFLNSGGDGQVMITAGSPLGGSFFGNFPSAVAEEETGDTGDTGGDTGGGTSGGGAGGGAAVSVVVQPTSLSVDMAVDTVERRTINITNLLESSVTVPITQVGLDNMVILGAENISLGPGETREWELTFAAPSEPGVYTGIIYIGGASVSVALNVKSLLLLFDSNIVVLNKDYTVTQGDALKTLVTLIPMGDPSRLDVTLNYAIKDYSGKIYLTKSETLLSTNFSTLTRDFDTGMLPKGNYVVALELIYPGGVAPSSAHFIILEREISPLIGKIILFLIIIILIIVVILIIILVVRRIRDKDSGEQGGIGGQAPPENQSEPPAIFSPFIDSGQ